MSYSKEEYNAYDERIAKERNITIQELRKERAENTAKKRGISYSELMHERNMKKYEKAGGSKVFLDNQIEKRAKELNITRNEYLQSINNNMAKNQGFDTYGEYQKATRNKQAISLGYENFYEKKLHDKIKKRNADIDMTIEDIHKMYEFKKRKISKKDIEMINRKFSKEKKEKYRDEAYKYYMTVNQYILYFVLGESEEE